MISAKGSTAAGGPARCLLRCSLFGSSHCARCSVPDHRGAPACPRCASRLYCVGVEGGRAQWLCGDKDCGLLVSFPAGDPDQEAAADAELAELKREKARVRQRISRARQIGASSPARGGRLRCHTKCPSTGNLVRPGARYGGGVGEDPSWALAGQFRSRGGHCSDAIAGSNLRLNLNTLILCSPPR